MNAAAPVFKTCLKCGHTRTATDAGPDYACPQCSAVYAKVEAAQRPKDTAAQAQAPHTAEQSEETAWARENAPMLALQKERERKQVLLAHVVYLLLAVPLVATTVIAVIVAYAADSPHEDDWVNAHFRWQKKTFWVSLLCSTALAVVGVVLFGTLFMAVISSRIGSSFAAGWGAGLLFTAACAMLVLWYLYRIIRGWVQLCRNQEP